MAKKKKTTKKATKKTTRRKSKNSAQSVNDQWVEGIATSETDSRSYSTKGKFEIGEVIDHKSFGRGVVKSHVDNEKIEVVFETVIKTLVHSK